MLEGTPLLVSISSWTYGHFLYELHHHPPCWKGDPAFQPSLQPQVRIMSAAATEARSSPGSRWLMADRRKAHGPGTALGNTLLFSVGLSVSLGLFPSCLPRQTSMGNQSGPYHQDTEPALPVTPDWRPAGVPAAHVPEWSGKSGLDSLENNRLWRGDPELTTGATPLPPATPVPLHYMASVSDKTASGTGVLTHQQGPFFIDLQ